MFVHDGRGGVSERGGEKGDEGLWLVGEFDGGQG